MQFLISEAWAAFEGQFLETFIYTIIHCTLIEQQ